MSDKIQAFYFSTEGKKLRYGDNRVIRVGRTHKIKGKPKCCEWGLHASVNVLDALEYAPSPMLYLVELSGDVHRQRDKCSASERKYIACFDTTDLLREFSRKQAMINIHKIKPYCKDNEYYIIKKYLEFGMECDSSAAWSAASSAASSAANKMLAKMIAKETGWKI